jgi:hypothetical protein
MTDRLEAAKRKGKQAAILIDDPLLTEALNKLEEQAIEALTVCSSDELIERRANVNAIRFLRRTLRAYLDAGMIAERSLKAN